MAEYVTAELIDRNILISELMSMKIDVTNFGRRGDYVSREVERFIHEEIVQLVRELPYYRI